MDQEQEQASSSGRLERLREQLAAEALQDVICSEAGGHETLRQTAQVASALRQLQLGRDGAAGAGPDEDAADASDADAADAFAGAPAGPLGVSPADLLTEALPPEGERQAALAAALPALEAELQRRCALVAAASGYSSTDYSGLPDHIRQLLAARLSPAAQVQAWKKAAEQAQRAVDLLQRAARLLADIVERHKLTGQKAADEAHAAFLRCECGWLREKLRVVQLQLQQAAYTPGTVGVLRQVAAEVDAALGAAAAQLEQATLQLRQYCALGPQFVELAREHAAALEALEEAEFELREVEQFQQLARVTG